MTCPTASAMRRALASHQREDLFQVVILSPGPECTALGRPCDEELRRPRRRRGGCDREQGKPQEVLDQRVGIDAPLLARPEHAG